MSSKSSSKQSASSAALVATTSTAMDTTSTSSGAPQLSEEERMAEVKTLFVQYNGYSSTSSSAKAPSTFTHKLKSDGTNSPKWQEEFFRGCLCYGLAGQEIVNDKRHDWVKAEPKVTLGLKYKEVQEDGTVQEKVRTLDLDTYDFSSLARKQDAFAKLIQGYVGDSGALMSFLLTTLEDDMLEKVKAQRRTPNSPPSDPLEYLVNYQSYDVYGMFKLVKKVVNDQIAANKQDLEGKFSSLKQEDGEIVSAYINRILEMSKLLEVAGAPRSNADLVTRLTDGLHSRYKIFKDELDRETDRSQLKEFPVVCQGMINWENKNPWPAAHSKAFVIRDVEGTDPPVVVCFNCGKTGHKSIDCTATPTVCTKCNGKWHMGIYCQVKESRLSEKREQNAKRKAAEEAADGKSAEVTPSNGKPIGKKPKLSTGKQNNAGAGGGKKKKKKGKGGGNKGNADKGGKSASAKMVRVNYDSSASDSESSDEETPVIPLPVQETTSVDAPSSLDPLNRLSLPMAALSIEESSHHSEEHKKGSSDSSSNASTHTTVSPQPEWEEEELRNPRSVVAELTDDNVEFLRTISGMPHEEAMDCCINHRNSRPNLQKKDILMWVELTGSIHWGEMTGYSDSPAFGIPPLDEIPSVGLTRWIPLIWLLQHWEAGHAIHRPRNIWRLQTYYLSSPIDDEDTRFRDPLPELVDEYGVPEEEHSAYMMRASSNNVSTQPHSSINIIIDSGASHHVVNHLHLVEKWVKPNTSNVSVSGVENNPVLATHVGVIPNLGKVLVVPDFDTTLISYHLLCKNGFDIRNQGSTAMVINHSALSAPVVAHVTGDNHYGVSEEDFNRLLMMHQPALERVSRAMQVFSAEQRRRAVEVINLHNAFGHISDDNLITAVNHGTIIGSVITASDVRNARVIYGPCPACLAGKATKPSFKHNSSTEPALRPGQILHCDIYALAEVSIGGNKYMLICVCEFSSYLVIIPLKSKSTNALSSAFIELIATFHQYNHKVDIIQTDHESNLAACSTILGLHLVELRQTPPYQHAQRIERYIRTINSRFRCVLASLPYNLPSKLYGELLYAVIYFLNDFPTSTHPTLTPRQLVENQKLNIKKRVLIPFGKVVMANVAASNNELRSEMAIMLGPSQRTYNAARVYTLETEVVVDRHNLTEIHMPQNFPWKLIQNKPTFDILPIKILSDKEGESSEGDNHSINTTTSTKRSHSDMSTNEENTDNPRKRIDTSSSLNTMSQEDDREQQLQELERQRQLVQKSMSELSLSNREGDIPGSTQTSSVQPSETLPIVSSPELEAIAIQQETPPITTTDDSAINQANTQELSSSTTASSDGIQEHIEENLISGVPSDSTITTTNHQVEENEESTESQARRMTLRNITRSWRDGPCKLARKLSTVYRISVRAALQSERAEETWEAMKDEVLNMLQYKVGHYVTWKDIPHKEKKNILYSFMFIKHKVTAATGQYERTKARLVGDGSRQNNGLYDIVSSTTVGLTTVFLLLNIASYYRASLVTYDIKGAFLHAQFGENDPPIYMKINKDVTDVWITLDPEAIPYVDSKGELLLALDKFIYGLKQSPYKFQLHLDEVLRKAGYVKQNADECLYLKRGHKSETFSLLSLHVDDVLQVATDDSLVTELKEALIAAYGTVTFHPEAESYLGMGLSRSVDRRTIKVNQHGLITKILDEHCISTTRTAKTPAHDNLFKDTTADAQSPFVDSSKYLSLVMTLMYVARLTRPDILMAVTYLATKSTNPTKGAYHAAQRVLYYLRYTIDLEITIRCEGLQLNCSCDASFNVHPDGKSHTGFVHSLGPSRSYLGAKSAKQKLTALSSTDAEIIALADCLKQAVWIRNMIRGLQLTPLAPIIMEQDNKSAIIMTTDQSRFKNSKHILPKISFVRDLHKERVVMIGYTETGEIVSDLLTKPKQGESHNKHRNNIMLGKSVEH